MMSSPAMHYGWSFKDRLPLQLSTSHFTKHDSSDLVENKKERGTKTIKEGKGCGGENLLREQKPGFWSQSRD